MKDPEFIFEFEISDDLFRESSNSESFLANIVDRYATKNYEDVDSLAIPLSIFSSEISPLRALVKFLHENRLKNFSEIANILSRDPRTIWTEYEPVKNLKQFSSRITTTETVFIDSKILSNRSLSILEAITSELSLRGYSKKDMAKLLNKSPKTIWTVLDRASKKEMIRGGQV